MEVLICSILFILVTFALTRLVKKKRIALSQAIAVELLFVFIILVIASTVFTRTSNGIHTFKLIPFWSWWKALSGKLNYLREIVLNMLLFLPFGLLLPFAFQKKISPYYAFLTGTLFSLIIECNQLLLCRGLFEWDDMIDNGIGAMIGCILSNKIIKIVNKRRK